MIANLPKHWTIRQVDELFDKLPIGIRREKRGSVSHGATPIVDQSESGFIGFHDDAADVHASSESPVATFANHTCEMRLMRVGFSVIQNVFPLVGRDGICDTGFFYYMTKGRVRPEEYKGHYPVFRSMFVPVPPLPEQRRIAGILAAFDNSIELNRRTSRTLESIVRAIFKASFIDFDPVHKRIDPGEVTTVALGDIPNGWRAGTLGEVAQEHREQAKPGRLSPDTPYIGLEHMPRRSIDLSAWGRVADVGSGKSAFSVGDILFGKLRPYFHKVGPPVVDGVCSTDIVVVRPKHPDWFGFVLAHLMSDAFVDYTTLTSGGTRMPRTKWRDMAAYPLALPPEAVARAFNGTVKPMIAMIHRSCLESRSLSATRDALLPQLLSGELWFS